MLEFALGIPGDFLIPLPDVPPLALPLDGVNISAGFPSAKREQYPYTTPTVTII